MPEHLLLPEEEENSLLLGIEQTTFNDPEAIKLWEEYLLGSVPERKREAFTQIWRQSGSPYRKEYAMRTLEEAQAHPDELFRATFTEGARGAPDTLHVGSYGGIHDTIAEMTHAYQWTHPELEDTDLYGETPLNLMENSPSLDYSYRRNLGYKGNSEFGNIPEWMKDYVVPNIPQSLASGIGMIGYFLGGERMERYDEEGTMEGEAHGPIEDAMYAHYDGRKAISEEEWERIKDALLNMTLPIPTPSRERRSGIHGERE